jgi:predicted DNA-binding transcriptional regulator AlpA
MTRKAERRDRARAQFTIAPIAVDRDTAALMVGGISINTFETRVRDGTLPPPRQLGGRAVWLVRELEEAANDLPVSTMLPPPHRACAGVDSDENPKTA